MVTRVFVDANVFFSKTLLDWTLLLRLHNPGMFQIHATEDVFAEVLANMREKRPAAPGSWTRRRLELMRENVDEVIQDFPEDLRFTGLDPHDYHVHAAAVHGQADVILTSNHPADITTTPDSEPYEIMTPDAFYLTVVNSNPDCLRAVVERQIAYWARRSDQLQLDDALRRANCPQFAERVRAALTELARNSRS